MAHEVGIGGDDYVCIGSAVQHTGIPPDQISFPQALTAVTDTVTAGFPPSGS